MLKAKDFRQEAWGKLKGRWGTMALVTFVYMLSTGVCSALSYIYIGWVVSLLITGPFALGFAELALNVIRRKEVGVNGLFGGFRNFGGAFLVNLLNGIFIFLWSLLLVIPGIIKSYSYSMSYYILADHPELSAGEVRRRSIEIMRGNKWRLFCLQFSFIGWSILCVLTLGILTFWVTPYEQAATAAFYQSLLPVQEEALPPAEESGNMA